MKNKLWRVIPVICLAALSAACLASCNNKLGNDTNLYVGAVSNSTDYGLKSSYMYFDGSEHRKIDVTAGQTVTFKYSSTVTKGELTMKVLENGTKKVLDLEAGASGEKSVIAVSANYYTLEVTGDETKGGYDISWTIK
jgi:hypothetical protein